MGYNISVYQVISLLNELLAADRPAIAALIANRVPCNAALAHHPTVQVHSQHGGFHVGLLGVLNGIFGEGETVPGPIRAIFDEDATLVGFQHVDEQKEGETDV